MAFGNDFRPVTSHSFVGTLNKSWGAHALKGGAEIRIYGERSRSTGNDQSGQYAVHQRLHAPEQRERHRLLRPAELRRVPPRPAVHHVDHRARRSYDEYSVTSGFFVQDDWRVNDRLTLNLGLRYEVESPMVERDNKSVSGFDYDYVQPIQGTVQANYAALNDPALKALVPQLSVKGGLKFVGVDDDQLYTTPKNTFLPRVGFAYQLDSKTVLRGGVGLFAGFLGERRGDVIHVRLLADDHHRHHVQRQSGRRSRATGTNALLTQPILEPVGNAARPADVPRDSGITFFNPNPAVSKQLRWQIGVQRAAAGQLDALRRCTSATTATTSRSPATSTRCRTST
ncbi:MAG: TonB-dependent receptor [Comamonadaceae bacterium]|nr:TonB-dependent receptor [Comamonadaceae bacterium]